MSLLADAHVLPGRWSQFGDQALSWLMANPIWAGLLGFYVVLGVFALRAFFRIDEEKLEGDPITKWMHAGGSTLLFLPIWPLIWLNWFLHFRSDSSRDEDGEVVDLGRYSVVDLASYLSYEEGASLSGEIRGEKPGASVIHFPESMTAMNDRSEASKDSEFLAEGEEGEEDGESEEGLEGEDDNEWLRFLDDALKEEKDEVEEEDEEGEYESKEAEEPPLRDDQLPKMSEMPPKQDGPVQVKKME